jgi:hypothetical protein
MSMLEWIRRLMGAGKAPPGLADPQAEALGTWLRHLDEAAPGLGERSLGYVLAGRDEFVLDDIARSRDPAQALHAKAVSSFVPSLDERRAIFSAPLPDPGMYVRLGKVLEAAGRQSGHQGSFSDYGVPLWFELLLWEASTLHPRVMGGGVAEETFLDHQCAEGALSADGAPPDTVLRLALLAAPTFTQYGATRLIELMPGLRLAVERHPDVAREALASSSAKSRARAATVLRRASCSLSMFLDQVVSLALDPAKTAREVGEAWLGSERDIALPAIRTVLREGEAARRGPAAALLARLGGAGERAFLEERQQTDPAPAVREAIAVALERLPADVHEPVERGPAALTPGPLGALGENARTALLALFAAWQKTANQLAAGQTAGGQATGVPGAGDVDEWLGAMQRPDFVRPKSAVNAFWVLHHEIPEQDRLLAIPGMTLGNVVRMAGLIGLFERAGDGRRFVGLWLLSLLLKAYRRASGSSVGLRELAAECVPMGIDPEQLGWEMLQEYGPDAAFTDDEAWPYFVDYRTALDIALGLEPVPATADFLDRLSRSKALAVLATMPRLPDGYQTHLWSFALGSVKAERALARRALAKLPDSGRRVLLALGSRNQVEREAAVEWLAQSGDAAAVPAIRAALAKEKSARLKAAMTSALEALGGGVDDLLDRKSLLAEAERGLAKGVPYDLGWFPFADLPAVHWSDGEVVEPQVIAWWLVHSRKLGSPEPGPILRRYAAELAVEEARALGRAIVAAWIARDVEPYPESEARARAALSLQQMLSYGGPPLTQSQQDALLMRAMVEPRGSATAQKGVLAVASALAGDLATPLVAEYLKTWYGMRPAQCKALLQMLAWVDGQGAIQLLLATATRFRTAGIRQTAETCVRSLAERRGWTLDELADRTVPRADLEGDGSLPLSYGARAFRARLTDELKLVVEDESGKELSALPEPRASDDAEAAANARKQLAACRKQVQALAKQQAARLYEAMCTERGWTAADFRAYLLGHPILSRLCQRVTWSVGQGETGFSFRPLGDGTLTDANDAAVELEPSARIQVLHPLCVPPETVAAWTRHLADYEIVPLFDQLGRAPYRLPAELRTATAVGDYRGHMIEAFKLRGRATKLGFQRGANDDGAWFSTYCRLLPRLGIEVVIHFTGNQLPEENRTVALETLAFRRGGQVRDLLPLGQVPAVLLSESYNDLRTLAAEGSGYDPDWQSKTQG